VGSLDEIGSQWNALKHPPPDRPAAGHPRASFARLDPATRYARGRRDGTARGEEARMPDDV